MKLNTLKAKLSLMAAPAMAFGMLIATKAVHAASGDLPQLDDIIVKNDVIDAVTALVTQLAPFLIAFFTLGLTVAVGMALYNRAHRVVTARIK